MPVKILLADKSITIQKVVEMLFSGKEYEVVCVSDGETALAEIGRVIPDVVLADVDLPRVDGYSFASRLKQNPTLAQTPVILMMSRDDVFDEARARQAGIIDKIAKPFESQDLIGKVKKALTAAPPRLGGPAPRTAAAAPRPVPAPSAPPKPVPSAPKTAVPSDIFGIIQEAPAQAGLKKGAAAPSRESVFEVEPEVEVEEPLAREVQRALPVGEKAVEEMRAGLGLTGKPKEAAKAPPEIVNFETLEMATEMAQEYAPPTMPSRPAPSPTAAPRGMPSDQAPAMSEEMLRSVAEETIARIVREVLEKVAWEVIPDLAERLIREEIERLKAGG